jgi:hypothetical protein
MNAIGIPSGMALPRNKGIVGEILHGNGAIQANDQEYHQKQRIVRFTIKEASLSR